MTKRVLRTQPGWDKCYWGSRRGEPSLSLYISAGQWDKMWKPWKVTSHNDAQRKQECRISAHE